MIERRPFGSGPAVSEIGVSVRGRDAAIVREARRAGVDLFHDSNAGQGTDKDDWNYYLGLGRAF